MRSGGLGVEGSAKSRNQSSEHHQMHHSDTKVSNLFFCLDAQPKGVEQHNPMHHILDIGEVTKSKKR